VVIRWVEEAHNSGRDDEENGLTRTGEDVSECRYLFAVAVTTSSPLHELYDRQVSSQKAGIQGTNGGLKAASMNQKLQQST